MLKQIYVWPTLPPGHKVCRVGTGWRADLGADVFVCVRNSAWQLENLTLDLLLLDEAHHYEPGPEESSEDWLRAWATLVTEHG